MRLGARGRNDNVEEKVSCDCKCRERIGYQIDIQNTGAPKIVPQDIDGRESRYENITKHGFGMDRGWDFLSSLRMSLNFLTFYKSDERKALFIISRGDEVIS